MVTPHHSRIGLVAGITLAVAVARADAGVLDELGSYERRAVDRALTARGLQVDPRPTGKRVRRIHVVNLPVFGPDAGPLRALNWFHRTTREFVIARLALLRPGDRWDDEIARETERNLRDPFITSLVVVLPVRSPLAGTVDQLIVTSDVWSLRTNSEFENQAGRFTKLTLALAENNLLGWQKHISLIFDMDEGEYSLGPRFVDPNLAGTRLRLALWPRLLFNRETNAFEGTQSVATLSYPLWSLARRWAGQIEARHKDAVVRLFRGSRIATYDNPDTRVFEELPHAYRLFDGQLRAEATRQMGRDVKYAVTLGHELRARRPHLLPDFRGTDADARAFTRDVLPRSELSSAVVWRQRVFTPRYVNYRDIEQFDLPETQQIGPDVSFELAFASKLLGSDDDFLRYRADARYVVDVAAETYLAMSAGVGGRATTSGVVDAAFDVELFGATPRLGDRFRVIAHAALSLQDNVEDNKLFVLGGETGLRGYPIGEFTGRSFALGNLELRTLSRKAWFMRVGGVAFWDIGHAADGLSDFDLHNDLGVGLRVLAPQTGESIYRLDWAIPLQGRSAGLPGRVSAGFFQAF